MVFPSISESDSPAPTIPMASPIVSSKSQPLHNFALTDLKWSPAPHPRFRRHPTDSTHGSPFRDVAARPSDSESDADGCRRHRAIDDLPPIGSSARDSGEKDAGQPVAAAENGKSSSKILLRIRAKGKSSDPPAEAEAEAEAEAPAAPAKPEASPSEPDELTSKVWNLRPRKPITKRSGSGGAQGQEIKSLLTDEPGRSTADERKVKFSIALTREEIEADFLAFMGSRPARRPRKRPRTVQRALDFCFPGLWLAAITPDSYKVVGNPQKG